MLQAKRCQNAKYLSIHIPRDPPPRPTPATRKNVFAELLPTHYSNVQYLRYHLSVVHLMVCGNDNDIAIPITCIRHCIQAGGDRDANHLDVRKRPYDKHDSPEWNQ